jgi:hypothetical protein
MTLTHKIHEKLPDGFHFADPLQIDSFEATGSVNGAAKVCLVAGAGELPRLACRLRPPFDWSSDDIEDYKDGWADARAAWPLDEVATPYAMGYRDAAEGRMKWHLAYCTDHTEGGCGA